METPLSKLVRAITGRSYPRLSLSQLRYMLQKGGASYVRGLVWAWLRLRGARGLMLGGHVKMISAGDLHYGRGVSIGHGSYMDCSASEGVWIGNGSTLREHAWLQCRSGLNAQARVVRIGERVYIGPFAVIGAGGEVAIGDGCQIGARFTLSAESHEAGAGNSHVAGTVSRQGVHIGRDCWIGNNVCVLDGVRIGERCVIGAGSVVTRSVPDGATAYGVPARVRSRADAN